MQQELKRIERSAIQKARRAKSSDAVAQLRAETVGKKGALGAILRGLGALPKEERPAAGQEINKVKAKIEKALTDAMGTLRDAAASNATVVKRQLALSNDLIEAVAGEAKRLTGNGGCSYRDTGTMMLRDGTSPISVNTRL